ncbi:MAG: site-specific DNA-methyltransferase [Flavobacteriaceae bacterium]|nr:site-specific DNA-methyltransferase [Flavobacteriaceae bacterium]
MIYIDPPYNTGKDFIYKDNYKDNLRNYQEVTQQTDNQGNQLSTNAESEGRFHSNWLNMMYPRLILARNLLTEDGLIFISIDENEVDNLKKICSEIFGESNFISNYVWHSNVKGRQMDEHIKGSYENILVYAKRSSSIEIEGIIDRVNIKNIDRDEISCFIRGYPLHNGTSDFHINNRPNLAYSIYYNPQNKKVKVIDEKKKNGSGYFIGNSNDKLKLEGFFRIIPKFNKVYNNQRVWRWGADKFLREYKTELLFLKEKDGFYIYQKKRVDKDGVIVKKRTNYIKIDSGLGRKDLLELGMPKYFDSPKPKILMKNFIEHIVCKNLIFLDFFSGSSSSAHAVLELNKEDRGKRRFIQVQLPEPIDPKEEAYKAGFENIAEIGKERIRRVIKKIKEEEPEKSKDMDLGFKVFKLDSSNIKSWDGDSDNFKQSLLDSVENIKEDRSQEDVLYEILLKHGLDLSLPIEERIIEKTKVFNVGHGTLILCLDDKITSKVAEGIGNWKKECKPAKCTVIFKDSGFTDVEKTNSIQTLRRFGIKEIRSI